MEISKVTYKLIRKRLKNKFVNNTTNDYNIIAAVEDWLSQHKIDPSEGAQTILYKIHGSVPYPYQEEDRSKILSYLRDNKFKQFKKDFLNE